MQLLRGGNEPDSELLIGGNAARDHKALNPRHLHRLFGFCREYVHDGIHEPAGDVTPKLRIFGICRFLHRRQHGRLKARKTQIQVRRMQHGPRQLHRAGPPLVSQPRDGRPARITFPQKLRRLIKRFARRIVQGFTQEFVFAERRHLHKLRVAP